MTEHQLHYLAKAIQNDINAAEAKLGEMLRQIGELPVDERTATSFMNGPVLADCCPRCGVGSGLHTSDCEAVATQEVVLEVVRSDG